MKIKLTNYPRSTQHSKYWLVTDNVKSRSTCPMLNRRYECLNSKNGEKGLVVFSEGDPNNTAKVVRWETPERKNGRPRASQGSVQAEMSSRGHS